MPWWPWLSRTTVRPAPPSTPPLSSMIDALAAEISARKRKEDGKLKVDLLNGRRVEEREPYWQYRFEVDVELRSLQDDTPVYVKVKADDVPGCVVSVRNDVLTVALKRDIGPAIPKALLIVDLTWLLERLRDRLQEVKDGSASLGASADDVLRPAAGPTADAEPHAEVMQGDRDMNEDQQRAVRRSLGSRTTFVWGPPGTGKTWTLARIVEAHYRAGRSVLLVSHTNVAVDTALEQVAERLCSEADFDRGLVLRRGPIVKDELRRRFGRQIIPAEVAARLGDEPSRRRQAERSLLDRCRVLATTVHRTYIHPGSARRFDTVVIDEASMLMPPLVYWAAGLATRSVTVAGDFRQLPPIVITQKDNAKEWLARDVFERAGIPDRLGSGEAMPYLVSLGRQYRMRRPICKAVNRHFYADRPLRSDPMCSGPGVRSEVEKFPFSSRALLRMDTAPYLPWASRWAPKGSHYNPFHALLARNIVLRLAEAGYLPARGHGERRRRRDRSVPCSGATDQEVAQEASPRARQGFGLYGAQLPGQRAEGGSHRPHGLRRRAAGETPSGDLAGTNRTAAPQRGREPGEASRRADCQLQIRSGGEGARERLPETTRRAFPTAWRPAERRRPPPVRWRVAESTLSGAGVHGASCAPTWSSPEEAFPGVHGVSRLPASGESGRMDSMGRTTLGNTVAIMVFELNRYAVAAESTRHD